jgi:predicted S18 family serine protease
VNVFFLTLYVPADQNRLSQLNLQVNALSNENSQLHSEVNQVTAGGLSPDGSVGYASLQAPAVSQAIQNEIRGRYIARTVIQKGSIMNISVEIGPGKGRVLVQTKPLMGVVFQGAANTAVSVAGNKTGFDLTKSDVIFSIDSGDRIAEVDGPSAGALMTLLTISAIENRPINESLTMTGTITGDGRIGAIGGVVAKAAAAKESGKTLFLIPAENHLIIPPAPGTAGTGTFIISQQVQQQVSAKDYIEKNIGINVTYVNTIDDIITESMNLS